MTFDEFLKKTIKAILNDILISKEEKQRIKKNILEKSEKEGK